MNERQREALASQLKDEQRVLRELRQMYAQAREDVLANIKALEARTDVENLQSIIYQKQYQQALKKQLDAILDAMNARQFTSISDYLAKSYEDAFFGVLYDLHGQGIPLIFPIDQEQATRAIQLDSKLSEGLYERLGVDTRALKTEIRRSVSRGVASSASWGQVAREIQNRMNIGLNRAIRIARTEGHRIQNESRYDAQVKAKQRGANVVKQWDATLDRRTRPTHQQLDGQIREVEEPYVIPSNGRRGLYPGEFGVAAEDINCRCHSVQRARWALDEDELQTLKERAAYFGLDKTEDFEDFKRKYLKATGSEITEEYLTKKQTELDDLKRKRDKIREDIERYYWSPEERSAHGISREEQREWRRSVQITPLGEEELRLNKLVQEKEDVFEVLKTTYERGTKSTSHRRAQREISQFEFGDGNGGVYKREDAIAYRTTDGTEIVFPKYYDRTLQTLTPQQAMDAWERVPEQVRTRGQKMIEVLDYENPEDAYWKKEYKNFSSSYMTGDTKISVYKYQSKHRDGYLTETFIHEVGHYIDILSDGTCFSESQTWREAMRKDWITSGEPSPTEYGTNSNAEDFAESVVQYSADRNQFEKYFPNRYRLLQMILGGDA